MSAGEFLDKRVLSHSSVSSMQVKMLEGGSFTHSSVAEFLNKAVEPPPEISVSNAVRLLQDIGAFEVSACFPVHCIFWALPCSQSGCTG